MDGDEPPCDGCQDRPPTLFASNALAWQVWSLLNEFDRPFASGMAVFPLPIPLHIMRPEIEARGGDEDDVDRICMVERLMFPHVQETYKSKS